MVTFFFVLFASLISHPVYAQATPTTPDSEPTVIWQELKAHITAPEASQVRADELLILVETWDRLVLS